MSRRISQPPAALPIVARPDGTGKQLEPGDFINTVRVGNLGKACRQESLNSRSATTQKPGIWSLILTRKRPVWRRFEENCGRLDVI
jgi:hypothetical protein